MYYQRSIVLLWFFFQQNLILNNWYNLLTSLCLPLCFRYWKYDCESINLHIWNSDDHEIHISYIEASVGLRGSTPFQGVIFYLWTDPDEICIELNSKIFFLEHCLDFSMVFEKIWNFRFFCVIFFNFQKNRSQKLSMLKKTETVLESTSNSAQNYTKRFSIFF